MSPSSRRLLHTVGASLDRSRTSARSSREAARLLWSRCIGVLLEDASGALVLASSAVLGGILAVIILGPAYVSGTSAFWSNPVGDAAMTLTGYRYYVNEPWHWPLATTLRTNAPEGANLIYFDAIPLVAVPAKLLRPWLGRSFHPYGWWHFAIFVLQSVFGARLGRALGARSLLGGVACAALCLSATAFTTRFYHADLNAHFLLLWALTLYANDANDARELVGRTPFVRGWVACTACALLVHPYLLAMVCAVALAAHLRRLRRDPAAVAWSVTGCFVALGALWWAMGYVLKAPTQAEASLLGQGSLNLLSLVVPYRSALLGPWSDGVRMDATGLQWDAQGFLGLGVLVLLVVAVATCGGRRLVGVARRHKALLGVCAVLLLYSVSPRIFVGRTLVATVPSLERLPAVLTTFRGNGRFFWPVAYLVAVGVAVLVMHRFGRRGVLVVGLASAFQLLDVQREYALAASCLANPWERHADEAFWSRTLPRFREVALYPSWYCWGDAPFPEHVSRAEREIELLAASNGLSTNHARTGRVLTDCGRGQAAVASLGVTTIPRGQLQVFFAPYYTASDVARLGGEAECTPFRDGWACSAASR